MNYHIDFAVDFTGNDSATGDARITSPTLFESLRSRYPDKSINPKWFMIRTGFEEAIKSNLFKTIEMDGGKSPVADLKFACDHPDKYYPVRIERIATVEELNQRQWLMLRPGDLELAAHGSIEPDGTYVIPKVRCKKKSPTVPIRLDPGCISSPLRLKTSSCRVDSTLSSFVRSGWRAVPPPGCGSCTVLWRCPHSR